MCRRVYLDFSCLEQHVLPPPLRKIALIVLKNLCNILYCDWTVKSGMHPATTGGKVISLLPHLSGILALLKGYRCLLSAPASRLKLPQLLVLSREQCTQEVIENPKLFDERPVQCQLARLLVASGVQSIVCRNCFIGHRQKDCPPQQGHNRRPQEAPCARESFQHVISCFVLQEHSICMCQIHMQE